MIVCGMDTPAPTILRLDPRGLKVLAHPLRSRLLTALREHGPATATALAERLGTNTGATSYHLRKLASVGLVEETDDGRGRERWWRAATEMHGWTERDVAGDPDAEAATDWLRRHYLATFVERYGAWLDDAGVVAAGLAGRGRRSSDYALRLSPPTWPPSRPRSRPCSSATATDAARRPPTRTGRRRSSRSTCTPSRSRGPPMTALDARSARTRYLVLVGLRWLPTGLLIPVIVLLALSRGLSLTEIGLVFSLQGLVVLFLELPTGGLSDALGRRPVLILASLVGLVSLGLLYVADSVGAVRGLDDPPGRLPGARQRAARGVVRRRDAGRRPGRRDRARPQRRQHGPEPRDRGRCPHLGRARRARSGRDRPGARPAAARRARRSASSTWWPSSP